MAMISKETKASLLLTAGIFSIVVIVWVIVFVGILQMGVWSNYESIHCSDICENSHQCDYDLSDRPVVQQPVNAWTSLCFIIGGLLVITRVRRPCAFDNDTTSKVFFLLACIYMSIASFVAHASLTTFWMTIDYSAVYTIMIVIDGHGIHAITGWSWRWIAIPVVLLSLVFSLGIAPLFTMVSVLTVITILVGVLLLTVRKRQLWRDIEDGKTRRKALGISILAFLIPAFFFAVAAVCWAMDISRYRVWCNPDSIVQGHGVWHCLACIALTLLWQFFDSRKRLGESNRTSETSGLDAADNASGLEEADEPSGKIDMCGSCLTEV